MALPNINVQNPNEGGSLPNLVLQNPETGEYVNIQMQVSATDEASAAKAEAWAVGERGGVPVSSTDQTYHNNAKYYAQAAEDAAETASAAYGTDLLAPTYSASKTYAIGDHVIYDGGYYACNTAIITAEAWTAAHWTKLTVGGEVTDLKDALYNTDELLHNGKITISDFVQGARWKTSPTIIREESTRLASLHTFRVFRGDVIRISNLTSSGYSVTFTAGNEVVSWFTTNKTYTFNTDADNMFILVAKGNRSEAITPAEFSADIVLISKHKKETDDELDNTKADIEKNTLSHENLSIAFENEMEQLGIVNLGSMGTVTPSGSPQTLSRENNIIGINTNGTEGTSHYYVINGTLVRLSGNFNNAVPTIPLYSGHRYKMIIKCLSENSYGENIRFQIGYINNAISVPIVKIASSGGSKEFDIENDLIAFVGCYVKYDTNPQNYKAIVIIQDITTYKEENNIDDIKRIQASRWLKNASVSPVSILHFSDIHGDGTELKKILEFYNQNKNIIDSIICTGDMAKASYASDFTFWQNTAGIEQVMVAMGNHEYFTNAATDHSKHEIAVQIQKWIGDYYSNWGVVRPEGASWYYKDYTGAKVRLIVLDCNLTAEEGGTDQKTWLESVLNDAKSNDYAVIIATHYVYLKGQGYQNLSHPFTDVFQQGIETAIRYEWDCEEYITVVQNFIDGGGTFICWLSGHTHTDNLRYVVSGQIVYDKQLDVVITAASPNHDYPLTLTTGDLPREARTPTASAFNVVTIDTVNKWLKVTRIGSNITTKMTHRDIMCYDYVNHAFLT